VSKLPTIVQRARRALSRREFPVVPPHIARIDYPGAEVLVGVTSRAEIMSRLRPAAKEPWTVRWLEQNARPGDVLFDVGANVGSYSLIAAALGLKAVAFEPAYSSYAALCDNVVLNGYEDSVTPLPVVLSERTALATLSHSDVAAGAAEHSLDGGDGAYRQPVLSYRLDDLVGQLGLPAPVLLKVDVDGAEASVLAGAQETLAASTLRSVLVEVDRDRGAEVVPLLAAAGLTLAERIEERDGRPLGRVWYGIFNRSG
jgi:FkbM family methyltransferase